MRSTVILQRVAMFAILISALGSSGCRAIFGPGGDDPQQRRETVLRERSAAVEQLLATKPSLKAKMDKAVGYGFFSNVSVNLFLVGTDGGYGVVKDKATGKDTYMRVAGAAAGLGLGIKDFRLIIMFNDASIMRRFVDEGWDFGGSADASAKAGEQGGTVGATGSAQIVAGMEIFQLTENGIALQAMVEGTKYWKDSKLNE